MGTNLFPHCPNYALLRSDQLDPTERTMEREKVINALKSALAQASALGHPNDKLPFFLFVHEDRGNALGVLTQWHCDKLQLIGCYNPYV